MAVSYFRELWTQLVNLQPPGKLKSQLILHIVLEVSGSRWHGEESFLKRKLDSFTRAAYSYVHELCRSVLCLCDVSSSLSFSVLLMGGSSFLLIQGRRSGDQRSRWCTADCWWLAASCLFNMQGPGREQGEKGNLLEAAQTFQLGRWFDGWAETRGAVNWELCGLR